jgi:hypothetical protein
MLYSALTRAWRASQAMASTWRAAATPAPRLSGVTLILYQAYTGTMEAEQTGSCA